MQELGTEVRVGDLLAGKYRVDRVLGAGGMGVVVAATHLQLDQVVALKFVRAEALHNPEAVGRFEREARVAARLKSEHAARIIDVGRLESGSPYIVMEFLEGLDLAQLLDRQGALSIELACDYLIQACDAIAEAHSLGIVHRDLKPGNLFLARASHGRQMIKVLDFGISKTSWSTSEVNATRTQAVMGSPGYMSPEQMRSTKNVDRRTDIWSLGIILYELIAGRMPFEADTFSGLCVKVAVDPHPPLHHLPTRLPAGFDTVIGRALEKNPAQRYASVVEFAQALAAFASAAVRERALRLAAAHASGGPALGPNANTIDAASGQAMFAAQGSRGRIPTRLLAAATFVVAVTVGAIGGLTRIVGGQDGHEPTAGAPSTPRQTSPRPATQAETRPETQLPDAGAASHVAPEPAGPGSATGAPTESPRPHPATGSASTPSPSVPASTTSAPATSAPPPTAPTPPTPSAAGKPRSRPPAVDPYSTPD